jgi:internalin A
MKSWRRRLRFSVGALLLVMTALALALGLVARRKQLEQDAIAAVTAVEGLVHYEDSASWTRTLFGETFTRRRLTIDLAANLGRRNGSDAPKATNEVLARLRGLPAVEVLELSHNPITDAQLAYLKPLRQLKTLYLFRSNVVGDGLVHIVGLRRLRSLHLGETPVSDAATEHLGRMTQLSSLRLDGTQISDIGVARLTGLTRLEALSLERTNVTDASVEALSQLGSLGELVLTGTAVTASGVDRLRAALPGCRVVVAFALGKTADDELLFAADEVRSAAEINARIRLRHLDGEVEVDATRPERPIIGLRLFHCTLSDAVILDLIREMPKLRTLNLRNCVAGDALLAGVESLSELKYLSLEGCPVTDEGLKHLSKFPALVELYLRSTDVTDEGLLVLTGVPSLRRVSLYRTKTTRAGIEALRKSMPGCQVN